MDKKFNYEFKNNSRFSKQTKVYLIVISALILLMLILSFALYNANANSNVLKKQILINDLNDQKNKNKSDISNTIEDISKNSKDAVKKSEQIINKSKYEKPKIKDTTDAYMLEYIVNFRPE